MRCGITHAVIELNVCYFYEALCLVLLMDNSIRYMKCFALRYYFLLFFTSPAVPLCPLFLCESTRYGKKKQRVWKGQPGETTFVPSPVSSFPDLLLNGYF